MSDTRSLAVDIQNHTSHMLAFEWTWHDIDGAEMFVPADAHPRLVVTVTDMAEGPAEAGG